MNQAGTSFQYTNLCQILQSVCKMAYILFNMNKNILFSLIEKLTRNNYFCCLNYKPKQYAKNLSKQHTNKISNRIKTSKCAVRYKALLLRSSVWTGQSSDQADRTLCIEVFFVAKKLCRMRCVYLAGMLFEKTTLNKVKNYTIGTYLL